DVRARAVARPLKRGGPRIGGLVERGERQHTVFTRYRDARTVSPCQRPQPVAEGWIWHRSYRLWHRSPMEKIHALARAVSNWGRWGADDERGTINFITPEVVRRGAACVKRGQVFSLGLRFSADGPQIGQGGRLNPLHLMSAIGGGYGADPEG